MANNRINYRHRLSCPEFNVEHSRTRRPRKDVKSLIVQFERITDKSLMSDTGKKNSIKYNRVLQTTAMNRLHKSKQSVSDSDFTKKNAITNKLSAGANTEKATVSKRSATKIPASKLPPPSEPTKDDKPKINGFRKLLDFVNVGELCSRSVSNQNSLKYKPTPLDKLSESLTESEMTKSTSSSQLQAGSPSYVRNAIKCFEKQNAESVEVVLRKKSLTTNGVANKTNDTLSYRKRTDSYLSATQATLDLSAMKIISDEVKILENTTLENKNSLLKSETSPVSTHRKVKLYPPSSPKSKHLKFKKSLPSAVQVEQDAERSKEGVMEFRPIPNVSRKSSYVSKAISKFEKGSRNPIIAVVDLQQPVNREFKDNENRTLLNKLAAGSMEKEDRKKLSNEVNDITLEKCGITEKQSDKESAVNGPENDNLQLNITENSCENNENNVLTVILYNNEETSDSTNQIDVLIQPGKEIDNVRQPFTQDTECQEQMISAQCILQGTNSIEHDQDEAGLNEDDYNEENAITLVYYQTELASNSTQENNNHVSANSQQNKSSLETENVGTYNSNRDNDIEIRDEDDLRRNSCENSRFENHEIELKTSITAETKCSKPDYVIIMRDSTTKNSDESCVKCNVENETQNKTEISQKQVDSETINNNVNELRVARGKSEWSLDKLSSNNMQIFEWSSDSDADMAHNTVSNEVYQNSSAQTSELDNNEVFPTQDQRSERSGEYTVPIFDSQTSIEDILSTVDDLYAHVENLCQGNPAKQRVSRLYSGKFGRSSCTPPKSPQEPNNNTKICNNEFVIKEEDKILQDNIRMLPDKSDDDEDNNELCVAEKYIRECCEEVENDPCLVKEPNSTMSKELYTGEWIRNLNQEFVANGPESLPDVTNDNDSVFSGISVASEDPEYRNVEYSLNAIGEQSWIFRDAKNDPMYVFKNKVNEYTNENILLRKDSATDIIGSMIKESEHEHACRRNKETLKNSSRRLGLMDEIISTERRYVEGSLRLLVEEYIPEMNRPDIPPGLVGSTNHIFGNVEILYKYHKIFLPELEACKKTDTDQIANCFLKHESLFQKYPFYSKNKPLSDSVMKDYSSYFTRKQKELRDPLDLASYLLSPVQRLGKYCLLMKSLAQECKKENINNEKVKEATEMLQKQMRRGNNLIAMDSIIGCEVNLQEQGDLLLRDAFTITPPSRKFSFEGMVFLFKGAFLITSIQRQNASEMFEFREFFRLTDMGYTNNESENLTFRVWFRKHDQKTFTLKAKKPDIKTKWTKEIYSLLWKQFEANKQRKTREQEQSGVIQTPVQVRPLSISNPKRKKSSPKAARSRSGSVWYSNND